VGDVVRTLPAAAAIRGAFPDAHLAWLVEPASASLLAGQPWIDEVCVFPRGDLRQALVRGRVDRVIGTGAGFVRALRARRFDLVVDFHAILKSGVLAWLSGAERRVSYARPFAREGAAWFATERAELSPPKQSRFDRNEGLARYLGVEAPLPAAPLQVPDAARAQMKAALAGERPIAIHPGTSDTTEHKRWTPEGYAAVAMALRERTGRSSIVTVGPARDDRAFADQIVARSQGAAQIAPETKSLLDLAAVFAASALYIGSDSGPMHVASLVGTPVVQLLGPTDPVENQPFPGTPSETVRVQIACNPCRRGCAAATCMRVISPDSVVAAAGRFLAAP
jgi:ADP-heptose:LPS heptosyltransferase